MSGFQVHALRACPGMTEGRELCPAALLEDPPDMEAAAVVVAHQIVGAPGQVLVAALLARLVLVGDGGAVAAALRDEARAEHALPLLIEREPGLDAVLSDGVGEALGVHRA